MIDPKVTLSNCETEAIHIPGKIQGQGFLIAVNNKTFEVNFISENFSELTGQSATSLLGKNLTLVEEKLQLTGAFTNFKFAQIIQAFNNGESANFLNPFYIEINNTAYNLIISISGKELVLELEPSDSNVEFTIQQTIGRSISGILSGKNLQSLFENAAAEIKNLINYDRVMIYRFNDDGHGEVIAEAKNETLQPFMGLHYPATDIPKQARDLYKINLTRIIADVHVASVPIITKKINTVDLDLTNASLRAVSPIHIQYLKNMGVASSFSISLISKGELWGLVACHNYTPKFINYKIREASKLIGQILSSALEYRLGEEDAEQFNLLNLSVNKLVKYIERENYIVNALTANNTTINNVTKASGTIIVFDNIITSVGTTPGKADVAEIIKWLKINMDEPVYYTNRFPEVYLPAKKYSAIASGILVCMISKQSEFIIWFKPEQVAELNWAGNPEKPSEKNEFGMLIISPRESFASWKQIVKETSEKWSRSEIAAAVTIREHIIYAKNRKENEIRLLNERLKIIYEQQDTFNFTISHDLKTPLSSIKAYSELLLKNNNSLDANAKNILERIQVSTDKMALLIKEIFNYSKIGRAGIELQQINMQPLINEIKKEITEGLQKENLQFIIGETPDISGDHVMIRQVFMNLINNAVKYSSRSNPSIVKVEGKINEDKVIYSIIDNGIGIEPKDQAQVFELFRRMDNAMDFEGTGIGLAIVKRIIEKHNATISLESVVGEGTTFSMSFKNYQ